jgi:hypothetical protein
MQNFTIFGGIPRSPFNGMEGKKEAGRGRERRNYILIKG